MSTSVHDLRLSVSFRLYWNMIAWSNRLWDQNLIGMMEEVIKGGQSQGLGAERLGGI